MILIFTFFKLGILSKKKECTNLVKHHGKKILKIKIKWFSHQLITYFKINTLLQYSILICLRVQEIAVIGGTTFLQAVSLQDIVYYIKYIKLNNNKIVLKILRPLFLSLQYSAYFIIAQLNQWLLSNPSLVSKIVLTYSYYRTRYIICLDVVT